MTGYRFGLVRRADLPAARRTWRGPGRRAWRSSTDRAEYLAGVRRIRRYIEAGDVYQVNLCRLLTAPLRRRPDPLALAHRLAAGNPAPYQGVLDLGDRWIVTASPELFLSRDGDAARAPPRSRARPRPAEPFADKDFPENIMITDLVRNDLGRIGRPGSVTVTELLARQEHPGLAHLVSTVTARLARRCRLGGDPGRDLPAGLGHRRAEDPCAAGDLRTGAGSPRALLRRHRLRRRRPRGGPGSRWASVPSSPPRRRRPAASCCTSAPAPASPTPPTRRPNGRKPNSRRPG